MSFLKGITIIFLYTYGKLINYAERGWFSDSDERSNHEERIDVCMGMSYLFFIYAGRLQLRQSGQAFSAH